MKAVFTFPGSAWAINAMLQALVQYDASYLARNPKTPLLYKSGVVYRSPPVGGYQDWLTIPQCIEQGACDCKDLVAWRVAELRMRGQRAKPELLWVSSNLWHVFVRHGNGKPEDPSSRLGMKVPESLQYRRLIKASH